MAAAVRCFSARIFFCVLLISMMLAQDEKNQFIFQRFLEEGARLQLDGAARFLPDGLLQLTDTSKTQIGHAFYRTPFRFDVNSSRSISFSTHFVFATIPILPRSGGHGMAFVIAPSKDFQNAMPTGYLGLFNRSSNGMLTNHILAVEIDTVRNIENNDIDGNHVGIDVNNIDSNGSAAAAYFSDGESKNITLDLSSGKPMQMWIDYDGAEELLNVTLAPFRLNTKPSLPLLSMSIDLSLVFLKSMYVGFSGATGEIGISDQYVFGWSFNSTGPAKDLDLSDLPPPPRPRPSPLFTLAVRQMILVSLVAVVLVLTSIVVAVYIVRKKKFAEEYEDWEKEYNPQRIRYKSLYKATKGFNEKEVIGGGGSGTVYKGEFPSRRLNEQVAVKKITHDAHNGMKEFVSEIVTMGRLRHRNLVQLRGYCRRKGELFVVYEYMSNGSLDKILYSDRKPNLNWFQRFNIIREVASGLFYLHEGWEQVVLHRDIKPGNILLDAKLNVKLGDFGLARLCDRDSKFQTTNLVGTIGYLAPELIRTGVANTTTDVYAFGVFMLEVVCGRRPQEPRMVGLVDWVIVCWEKGNILEASDKRMEDIYVEDQMEMILKLGLFCAHNNPTVRPSIREVMQYLDGDTKLPDMKLSSSVVDGIRGSSDGFEITMSNSSLLTGSSSYTTTTVDSIIIAGR